MKARRRGRQPRTDKDNEDDDDDDNGDDDIEQFRQPTTTTTSTTTTTTTTTDQDDDDQRRRRRTTRTNSNHQSQIDAKCMRELIWSILSFGARFQGLQFCFHSEVDTNRGSNSGSERQH